MEHNFRGDSLRLDCFLRVVRNFPQRPARGRRPTRQTNQNTDKTQPIISSLIRMEEAPVFHSKEPEIVQSGKARFSLLLEKNHEKDEAGPMFTAEKRSTSFLPDQEGNADFDDNTEEMLQKIKRKRRLPVNQLAIVRTTTLQVVEQAEEHPDICRQVPDTDPIEDSQTIITKPAALTPSASRQISVVRPEQGLMASKHPWRPAVLTKKIHMPRKKGGRPDKWLTPKIHFDGFEGAELSIPDRAFRPQHPRVEKLRVKTKAKSRTELRDKSRSTQRMQSKAKPDTWNWELPLAVGDLPLPSDYLNTTEHPHPKVLEVRALSFRSNEDYTCVGKSRLNELFQMSEEPIADNTTVEERMFGDLPQIIYEDATSMFNKQIPKTDQYRQMEILQADETTTYTPTKDLVVDLKLQSITAPKICHSDSESEDAGDEMDYSPSECDWDAV
ncbi:hypothetical protein GQ43DRAFT_442766 [Delitschia confertaspora ATCC 74209]|uniref:Uncharacterized protein n=1 Tax=Delitschia confertaspora ATCC 74209 TaxID=1513339 RepID=A0A9P4MWN3_9PLEO|nr:hypothetical protein GQ43DRAFT_442766 [Delitschia confertaspora ATCC 74209]